MILEVRAGVGGEDAALFCRDLVAAYSRFAQRQKMMIEPLWLAETDQGGLREAVLRVVGANAGILKHEAGVHRLQRVPNTEKRGRRQTSTVAVTVLAEVPQQSQILKASDLRIEAYRASGPGGQNRNKVETAIRVTHLPTGLTAIAASERSQSQNRERALAVLAARLTAREQDAVEEQRVGLKRQQAGLAERGTHVRNYCFWRDEATNCRTGQRVSLKRFLAGEITLLH